MENNKSRTGFTKIGFSKAGFACCGHYTFCEMGKKVCFYNEKDPEAQNYCAAFLRNHKEKKPLKEVVSQNEQQELQAGEEQLSLF